MAPRLELHELLKDILGSDNVYFQPPPTVQMKYPCIVYKRDWALTEHAGNLPYLHEKRYLVTVIDRNPDSEIPQKIAMLPKCIFDKHFTASNLNHDAYKLFY